MNRRACAVCVVVALSACRQKPVSVDAGPPPAAAARSIELRTAFFTVFPEIRGAEMTAATASLERTIRPVPERWRETFHAHEAATAADEARGLPGYSMWAEERDGALVLRAELAMQPADAAKLLNTRSSLSSAHFATWFPHFDGAQVAKEEFTVDIHWSAAESRAVFLVSQMVGLCLRGGWALREPFTVDGGESLDGAVPLTLFDPTLGALIHAERRGGNAWVVYRLQTQAQQGVVDAGI